MKGNRAFEWVVILLGAVILLLMFSRLAAQRKEPGGLRQIEVERTDRADTSVTESGTGRPDSLLEGEVIDLNTASRYDLERLPGIGTTRAQAILNYRQEHGPFQSVDELLQVTGIGPETLDALKDYVTAE